MNRALASIIILVCALSCVVQADDTQVITLSDELRVRSGTTSELSFDLPESSAGKQVRLSLDARFDSKDLNGSHLWMKVAVNETILDAPDLMNKPFEFTMANGMDATWVVSQTWRVVYAPDFGDTLRTDEVPFGIPDVDPYRFVWDITKCAKAGKNLVKITHPQLFPEGHWLVLRGVQAEVGEPVPSMAGGGGTKPAPTGPLPKYVARGRQPVPMNVEVSSGGAIRVTAGKRTLNLTTRTSEPEGKWVTATGGNWKPVKLNRSARAKWSGTGYAVSRKVLVKDDHVKVFDTIRNTGDKLVGVIVENRLLLDNEPGQIRLAGRPAFGASEDPGHPTAMARFADVTVGLTADNDLFRVHSRAFSEAGAIGISDPYLGLEPGKSLTLEWSIYPVPGGDYWDFINAVRRNWGSNFTIPGCTAFDNVPSLRRASGVTTEDEVSKETERYRRLAGARGASLVLSGQTAYLGDEIAKYGGEHDNRLAEGTAIPLAKRWCAEARNMARVLHDVNPNFRHMVYLHTQICTELGAKEKYADSKLLDEVGNHVTTPYRYPIYMYLTTLNNSYGKALMKALPHIVDDTGADGIFNDEFPYAHTPWAYDTEWDGCSVTIDPKTHKVTGKRSSSILLQQPWKVEMVNYLRGRGKIIVGNFAAHTRTMLELKVPMLLEMNSYSTAIWAHLGTPWCMGEMDISPNDAARAKMARRMLDYAGVYTVYPWNDEPKGAHFTTLMYPITPVELREGMVFGKERIITNRSGSYGWPDAGPANVYVIDGQGQIVDKPDVKLVRENGRSLAEVRMPSDHFAILVKD